MKTLLAFLLIAGGAATANTYSYSVYNPSGANFGNSDLGSWPTPNGSLTCAQGYSCPIYSPAATGGSIIWTAGGTGYYEVAIDLASPLTTGGVVVYLNASAGALSTPGGTNDLGTAFDAVQFFGATCGSNGACSMQVYFYERTNSKTALAGFTQVSYMANIPLPPIRIVSIPGQIHVLVNDQYIQIGSSLAGGYPGVGAFNNATGVIQSIQIGPRCLTAPAQVPLHNMSFSAYPNSVSMAWTEPTEPADVAAVGIVGWQTWRNSASDGTLFEAAAWTDANVVPQTNYTYAVAALSFHGVAGAASPALSVDTPSTNNIDPRRTGVKPLGSYWGSSPEQIDVASGNLNLSLPVVTAQGRGGWTVPLSLSYNSQNWKQDSAGVQMLAQDVGYGLGWRLMAGSITPYWNSQTLQIDHYLYIDSTGAEYRLYQMAGSTTIWTSQLYPASVVQSGESIYVYYDSSAATLHFRDGSFWIFDCLSSGLEQDAGTLYPTTLEDRNGNQVILSYDSGKGFVGGNSSARINVVEDTRAQGQPHETYDFFYNPPDANGIIHLGSIGNYIGTGETYWFYYTAATIKDPFQAQTFGTYSELTSFHDQMNFNRQFAYDGSGNATSMQLPYGGYLRWTYGTNGYSWSSPANNTLALQAVSNRYLASASTASTQMNNNQSATEWAYQFAYTPAAVNTSVVPTTCVSDVGAQAQRCWSFWLGQSGNTLQYIGVAVDYQRLRLSGGTATLLRDEGLTYFNDGAGNPYLRQATTTDSTGASPLYSQTTQQLDQYGNITYTWLWDWSTSQPTANSWLRAYTNLYRTACTNPFTANSSGADCPYMNAFITNLQTSVQLQDTGLKDSVMLAQNTYDNYGTNPLANVTGLTEFDASRSTAYTIRGNVTQTVAPSGTTNVQYDITGMVTQANDNQGHAVSISAATGTNNSAPGLIQPNTGQPNDGNLATSMTYSPFLGVTSSTAPNASQTTLTYDAQGRPSLGQSATGANTTYTYAFGTNASGTIANGPYTTTATTNTHWTTAVTDGLGRSLTQTAGYGTTTPTTVSTADSVYGPCGCSPAGKLTASSQPYAPGGTEVWTRYAYDALGRTLSVTAPDGVSKTSYTYQGNWTTVVDAAGKWKQYEQDVFGNTLVVVEPDPAVNPQIPNPPSASAAGTLVTRYTYDFLSHLTGVQMIRGTVTQNRTFTYDPVTERLTSVTMPEMGASGSTGGTTSYTYNADGTLATRTDPKSQVTKYAYDSYQRVITVTHGTDATQTYSYGYDAGTNGYGRLTSVTWGVCGSSARYSESYGYTAWGQMSAKSLSALEGAGCSGVGLSASFSYDSEGKPATVTYPGSGSISLPVGGLFQSDSYDSMSRLTAVTDTENVGPISGCTPPATASVAWGSGASYNAAGQLFGLERLQSVQVGSCGFAANYFNQKWQYNTLNQLTEIDTSAQSNGYPVGSPTPGAASVFFARYHFSGTQNNGQVMSVDDARQGGANIGYTYDALKRLTTATTTAWNQAITYDGFGNITSKSVPPGSAEPVFPGVVSSKNQLAGVSYDANGNALGVNAFALTYDMENRLATATSGTAVESYAYDESNHRVEKTNGSGDYLYFYGPDGRLLSIRQVQKVGNTWLTTVIADRVYFGGMLLGSAATTGFGDVSTMTDRLGTAVAGYPYGTDLGSVTAGNDQPDFATYTKDGTTGFEYAMNRYYSAGLGRFLSVDPYGGSAHTGTPQSWNRYMYTWGDPINNTDPAGTDTSDCDDSGGSPGDYSYGQTHCYAFVYDASQTTPQPPPTIASQIGIDPIVVLPSLDDLFSDVGPSDPTSDGSGPLPDCSISLYSRPVPFWPSPGKHTYILFEDSAFETTNDPSGGWILEGGPNPPGFLGALTGTLIGYAGPIGQTLKGSNPALPSNREVGTTWTNTSACAVGISLIGDIDGYNGGPGVPYTFLGSIGYNSNSFTFTLLEEAGLLGYFGNPPFWTPGWGKTVPGL